jgi:hypothetical protein
MNPFFCYRGRTGNRLYCLSQTLSLVVFNSFCLRAKGLSLSDIQIRPPFFLPFYWLHIFSKGYVLQYVSNSPKQNLTCQRTYLLWHYAWRSPDLYPRNSDGVLDWQTVCSRKMALIEFGLSLFRDGFVALRSGSSRFLGEETHPL